MKKPSSSFLVLAIAALFVSLQSFAQRNPHRAPQRTPDFDIQIGGIEQNEVISESVQQTIRAREILRLSELLRISPQEQDELEVIGLTIVAQSFQGQGRSELSIDSFGRPLSAPQKVKRQLSQIQVLLPAQTLLEGLELNSNDEIFIESITAEVRRLRRLPPLPHLPNGPRIPGHHEQQVMPNQLLTLQIHQQVRGHAEIQLKHLVKQQLGLTLEGAEIQRIIVEGQPVGGRMATVQVELNNRIVGHPEVLSIGQRRKPIRLLGIEEVRGNLRLHVRGDAFIQEVIIRVGQVRPIGRTHGESWIINTQISSGRPLLLSQVRPHESRLVSAITLRASTWQSQAEVSLLSQRGELLGSVMVAQVPMLPRIQLFRPVSVRELRLQSWAPVTIESLEIEFDHFVIGRL